MGITLVHPALQLRCTRAHTERLFDRFAEEIQKPFEMGDNFEDKTVRVAFYLLSGNRLLSYHSFDASFVKREENASITYPGNEINQCRRSLNQSVDNGFIGLGDRVTLVMAAVLKGTNGKGALSFINVTGHKIRLLGGMVGLRGAKNPFSESATGESNSINALLKLRLNDLNIPENHQIKIENKG